MIRTRCTVSGIVSYNQFFLNLTSDLIKTQLVVFRLKHIGKVEALLFSGIDIGAIQVRIYFIVIQIYSHVTFIGVSLRLPSDAAVLFGLILAVFSRFMVQTSVETEEVYF